MKIIKTKNKEIILDEKDYEYLSNFKVFFYACSTAL